MVPGDLAYVRRLITDKVIADPVLELGTGYGGETCRDLCVAAGLDYYGTDLTPGPTVDFVVDFERAEDLHVFGRSTPFGSILILNVLEHTFEPIRVLDNTLTLLRPGGCLVVATPAVWPLHNYPFDAWRILPNFYEQFAERRGLRLLGEYFEYVGHGRVEDFRNPDGSLRFPRPGNSGLHRWYSRVVHRLFGTFGRGMFQPSHIGVAAVFKTHPRGGVKFSP